MSVISSFEKRFSINSIWVLIKRTFNKLFSIAFFAPCQIRAPLISMPIKFFFGYFFAKLIEYSPLPHPNSRIIGFLFLKKNLDHYPLWLYLLLIKFSLFG